MREQATPGRRVMLTEILAQVSADALQGETLEEVLQRIVDCVARHLPVAIASIILLNEEGTHFVQEVWSGKLDLQLPFGMPWPVEVGAAGRCVRTGEVQLIADVACDPDYVPGNETVQSEYIVPIRHRTRLHGVLNLESTHADFFTPEVRAMFDAVALQIAGTIHLARVVRELEVANRKLEQLSMSDGLTGIANRRCFDLRLVEEWHMFGMAVRSRCCWSTSIASRRSTMRAATCTATNACGNSRAFARVLRKATANWSRGTAAKRLRCCWSMAICVRRVASASACVGASRRWRWRIRLRVSVRTSRSASARVRCARRRRKPRRR